MPYSEQIDFNDPAVRRYAVERGGFLGFLMVYLGHYLTVEPADFHFLLAKLLNDPDEELLEIIGFRGSAKSTFATLALPLYLALEHKFDFIIVGGDTTTQTKLNIANIRFELEDNPLIREDYGETFNPRRNWAEGKLQLLNGVLILGRSRGQKMRGLRHRQYRPQIVIIDDPEDLEWIKKKENRDKTESWFTSEVIPAQQEDKSKLILIGNLLHKDALMMRIKKRVRGDGTPLFRCLEFPLIDKKTGEITWKGKYPSQAAVQRQKEKVGSTVAWAREYLLTIIPEEDQIIKESDIHRYPARLLNELGPDKRPILIPKRGGLAIDLAIGEKETDDFTAMAKGIVAELWGKDRLVIFPNPINQHLRFSETITVAENEYQTLPLGSKVGVEDVAYQKAAIQELEKKIRHVVGLKPVTDKRARLETVAPYIKDGTVVFPDQGCQDMIDQLLDFGIAENDDMVDSLTYLVFLLLITNTKKGVIVEKADRM